MRDAMDAMAHADERRLLRTAKSCGPDAPTLAFKLAGSIPQAMVAKEPGHQGEREVSRKTIVQGMPGRFRRTCGDYRVLTTFCTRAAGATSTRHSLRPLIVEGQRSGKNSGASRRENTNPHPAVIVRLDRTIQYSEASAMNSRTRGVLDTPPTRGMTPYVL